MQLQCNLQKDAIDLATCWWMHPEHPFSVGTNSYAGPNGLLTITWRGSTPAPDEVRRSLGASEDSFLVASARGEPIPTDKITDQFRSLGFVDASNRSTLFLLDLSSPLIPVLAQSSSPFVRLVATHPDMKEIAHRLVSFLPITSPARQNQPNEMFDEIVRKAMAEERRR